MLINWRELGWSSSFAEEQIEVLGLSQDTRHLLPGAAFFAYDGSHMTALDTWQPALAAGAKAVFMPARYRQEIEHSAAYVPGLPLFFAIDFLERAGETIAAFYQQPSLQLKCIGVTGTNGKTTIAHAFKDALLPDSAYIGTLGASLPAESSDQNMTTPPTLLLQQLLARAVAQGAGSCALECSSHGLVQGRLAGISWQLAVFTNLTEDHLDYHRDMESYFEAKKLLFAAMLGQKQKAAGAIINTDDPYGRRLADWLIARQPSFPVVSLGYERAVATISQVEKSWGGYSFQLEYNQASYRLSSHFIGHFNVYNLASVFLGLLLLGVEADDARGRLEDLRPVPGRMEILRWQEKNIVIDYAHTPDALEKVLLTLAELSPRRIVVVFGCGGDRDQFKRSMMGKIAADLANHVIITNDNPRSEKPEDIAAAIVAGIGQPRQSQCQITLDRRAAIEEALARLESGDVLLVAGKGHENYQIIGSQKNHFSDREVVKDYILRHPV